MTYMSHTASRIKEEVYRRHYLGRAALEERRKFLAGEAERVETEFAAAERAEREAGSREDCCNRVIRYLPEIKFLFPSVAACVLLKDQLATSNEELAAVDTQSFKELEGKRKILEEQLTNLKNDNDRLQKTSGGLGTQLTNYQKELDIYTISREEKEESVKSFGGEYPLMIGECEGYAEDQLAKNSIEKLTSTHESTLKNFKTRTENCKKDYNILVRNYDQEFHYLLGMEPSENAEAENLLKRLETSELPEYREKIA
jgi:hypothetical protein